MKAIYIKFHPCLFIIFWVGKRGSELLLAQLPVNFNMNPPTWSKGPHRLFTPSFLSVLRHQFLAHSCSFGGSCTFQTAFREQQWCHSRTGRSTTLFSELMGIFFFNGASAKKIFKCSSEKSSLDLCKRPLNSFDNPLCTCSALDYQGQNWTFQEDNFPSTSRLLLHFFHICPMQSHL